MYKQDTLQGRINDFLSRKAIEYPDVFREDADYSFLEA